MVKKIFVGLLVVALLATGYVFAARESGTITLDNAYVSGRILRITASNDGIVDPYSAKRAEYAAGGQRLFNIRNTDQNMKLIEYKESLRIAIEDELLACKELAAVRTNLGRANTKAQYVDATLMRSKSLAKVGMISKEALEGRQLELDISAFDRAAAQHDVERSSYKNRSAIFQRSRVQHAVAQLQGAFFGINASEVKAPGDGYIYEILTYPGQYVKKGENLLVFIPKEEQVIEANVLESEIASISPGNTVTVLPDVGKGKLKFSGVVESIVPSVAATFSQLPRNNMDSNWIKTSQRIPVLITLAPQSDQAGMLPLGSSVKVVVNVAGAGAQSVKPAAKKSAPTTDPAEQILAKKFDVYLQSILAEFLDVNSKKVRSCN